MCVCVLSFFFLQADDDGWYSDKKERRNVWVHFVQTQFYVYILLYSSIELYSLNSIVHAYFSVRIFISRFPFFISLIFLNLSSYI